VSDKQTAIYICQSLSNLGHKVKAVDTRAIINDKGPVDAQARILAEIDRFKLDYDLIIVLKGLEMTLTTLNGIKAMFPKAKMVNWFFDKYLGEKPIWETDSYFDTLKVYDYYFCSLKGVADKLVNCGFTNVKYLAEGCFPLLNGEVYMNNFQKEKYGEDIAFCGTLGFFVQHSNRVTLIKTIVNEGYRMKVWGDVVCEWKYIPQEIREVHQQQSVINEQHSMVCQTSLINLCIDQDPTLDKSYSARLYRIMCAGGLALSTPTKGIQEVFKINGRDVMPTGDEEVIVFYDKDNLIELIDFLLEHDDIRKKIAKNGQKIVLAKHTFQHRVAEMLEIVGGDLSGKEKEESEQTIKKEE
jgi:hypothetical protein